MAFSGMLSTRGLGKGDGTVYKLQETGQGNRKLQKD